MHETGRSGLEHWDDPEGWDGEGDRREGQDGEPMSTHGWFIWMYGKSHHNIAISLQKYFFKVSHWVQTTDERRECSKSPTYEHSSCKFSKRRRSIRMSRHTGSRLAYIVTRARPLQAVALLCPSPHSAVQNRVQHALEYKPSVSRSKRLSSFEEALLVVKAQDWKLNGTQRSPPVVQKTIQCYVTYDKKRRASIQTSLGWFFRKVDRIESSKESEPASTSGVSEIALRLLLRTILQLLHPPPPLPPPVSNSSCLFAQCQPCMPAVVLYYCTFQGIVL